MIKDAVVQLTGSEEDEVRLVFAAEIARNHGAHIIGVHLHLLPELVELGEPSRSSYVQTLLEQSNKASDEIFSRVEAAFGQLDCSRELHRLHGFPGELGAGLAVLCRSADLFIGTRPYGDMGKRYKIEEGVLFGSGRACLFLPPGAVPRRAFEKVFVAWDGSRSAARALAEAMPFLVAAKEVVLGYIAGPAQSEQDSIQVFADVMTHLQRYGVNPTRVQASYHDETGEQLAALAYRADAGLIVSGAYGHPKWVEWTLGGVTRYLLGHSNIPVLMAH